MWLSDRDVSPKYMTYMTVWSTMTYNLAIYGQVEVINMTHMTFYDAFDHFVVIYITYIYDMFIKCI